MNEGVQARIQWAPKVRRSLINQVYHADALGLVDEERIAALGFGLHQRCRSILMVTDARQVDCPCCHGEILCPGARWSRAIPIDCPRCGWHASYGQWRDSWGHQDLVGGNAVRLYRSFYEDYPKARAARERLLMIDQLIHAFHWSARKHQTWRPVASQLIEGKPEEVLAFLDKLTGETSTDALRQTTQEWQARLEKVSLDLDFMREMVRKSGIKDAE